MANRPGVKAPNTRNAKPAMKLAPASSPAVIADASAVKKPRTSPAQFWREVQAEGRKITWTSWKETWITSVMVLIMVVMTGFFFAVVDGLLHFAIQQLLAFAAG